MIKNKFSKITVLLIACICLMIAVVAGMIRMTEKNYEYTDHEYVLTAIEDDVYGYYNTVSSSIPSQNYEQIVLCVNGQILTLKGTVNIYFTDSTPKLTWRDCNIIHADIFDVYVPSGSLEYRENVGV